MPPGKFRNSIAVYKYEKLVKGCSSRIFWLLHLIYLLLQPTKIARSLSGKIKSKMKENIHPKSYRLVVFKDMSNGTTFLSRSTAHSKETIQFEDGNEYPLIKVEISNTSHPFYTGKNIMLDTTGRIDKFKKKYAKKA